MSEAIMIVRTRYIARFVLSVWAIAVIAGGWAWAQQQQFVVQPSRGQSQAQMQRDMADCQAIARKSTGYDPAAATQTTQPAGGPQRGGRARGAARGAAAGAAAAEVRGQQYQAYDKLSDEAKQEYRQNQARSGAAAGAVVGGARQRQQRRAQRTTEQQAAAQSKSAYDQAYKSCLLARGYSVTP